MSTRSLVLPACLAGAIFVFSGCGQSPPAPAQPEQPASQAAAPAALQPTDEMKQVLAKADAVDGTEDHVVSKCASCQLLMDGSPDYALTVGDYTMQFCSADCKENFSANLAESLLALKPPEAPGGQTP